MCPHEPGRGSRALSARSRATPARRGDSCAASGALHSRLLTCTCEAPCVRGAAVSEELVTPTSDGEA